MSIKKKGTPEKISTLTEAELKTLRGLINKALQAGLEPEQVMKPSKEKK